MAVSTRRIGGGVGKERDDEPSLLRVDLHLHSVASGQATNWWVKGLGLGVEPRESYTTPVDAYQMAKRAGMDFVTLTDHETIAGALTLTDHPDFLTGVEVAARFPEDGNTVDILVYGVDPRSHQEIQARRADVYALVDYLREAGLVHVLAHPLFSPGAPVDRAGIEKRLVLFGLWEFVNGSRPVEQNRLAGEIAGSTGAIELRQLARRHGLAAPPHRAIAGTGGSDDHAGIYGGTTYSLVPRVRDTSELLAALAAGEVRPGGDDGSVEKMAHTGFKIAGCAIAAGGVAADASSSARVDTVPRPSADSAKLLEYLPLLSILDGAQIREALAGWYERRLAETLTTVGGAGSMVGLLGSLGRFVEGHLFIAPYVAVHGYFGRERQRARTLRRELCPADAASPKVGVFVDEMDQVHGVATLYRNLQEQAEAARDGRVRFVQCGDGEGGARTRLRAVATLPLPLYAGRSLSVPSFLDVLDHIVAAGYEVIHVAAPGPLGVAALIAGNALGLPVIGAYHTEFGRYAEVLSGDVLVAEIVERLVREFYQRCDVVAVSSRATATALRRRGYQLDRCEVLRNGVDTQRYRPDRRDERLRRKLGDEPMLLLYAGRVSREKGLDRLAAGYEALRRRRQDVRLVVAGDGPYREELAARLGPAATFTGELRGDDLARAYASCDIFVFPSVTDTLGRVVAEAQASGLPAVVFDQGGPSECLRPRTSGFVVAAGDESAFWARVEQLLDDPRTRQRMSKAARAFAQTLSWANVLDGLLHLYADVAGTALPPTLAVEPTAAGAETAA